MQYLRIIDLARLLNLDYDFLRRYLKKEKEGSAELDEVLGKYHSDNFLNHHLISPNKDKKITVDDVLSQGLWKMNEVYECLQASGIEIHYTTLWRKVNNHEVTHLKINSAFRFPIDIVKEEIKQGKYNRKLR